MPHELQALQYDYDSLEPEIDQATMQIHHTKHHQTYVDKLNKALENYPEIRDIPIQDLIRNIENISQEIRPAIQNNGGGHLNHSFFWQILKKDIEPFGEILTEIKNRFGSFENFKTEFITKSNSVFGSGWTWLVLNNNELEIVNTTGHNNPISQGMIPLLVIDLWEHAYYLKYQNKKNEYIENFFNIINWQRVNEIFVRNKQ